MTNCDHIQELLPWYVNQTLDPDERRQIATHLEDCDQCATVLVHWRQIAYAVAEPATVTTAELLPASESPLNLTGPAPAALRDRLPQAVPFRHSPQEIGALARVQLRLLPWGLWPAVAVVLALGVAIVLTSRWDAHTALGILAPLAAAGSVALACTRENDPRIPIALASPITARLVLLTRLVIVLAYDILLTLAASLVLILTGHQALDSLLSVWLAPMLGLSGAALLATIILDPAVAVGIAFALWILRWTTPAHPSTIILLLIAAACLTVATIRIQEASA